ncbi:hypothetical protein E5288_WYG000965 [Bos mutus]|uniref:Uncharacterized protein n=1 Tax=Bos mutus TaxID=72004 RepID=A0A6B0RUU2_9CETA|nr:hypothetical protein [Bos mutus]
MLRLPRLAPGYRKADLPHSHSGSPPTQHLPCAKSAGQVGGLPSSGLQKRGSGRRVGEAGGYGDAAWIRSSSQRLSALFRSLV